MRTEAAVALDVSQDILVTIDNFAELPSQARPVASPVCRQGKRSAR